MLGGADDTVSADGDWTLITTTHTNPRSRRAMSPSSTLQRPDLSLQNGIEVDDAPTIMVNSGAETIFTLEDRSIEICNTTFGDGIPVPRQWP